MRTLEAIGVKCAIMFMLGLSVFFVKGVSCAEEGNYPIKVEIIDKAHARYDTPENAYIALYSAQMKKDLEWLYETLTEESVEEIKRLFEEAGIDPIKIFDSEIKEKQTVIIGKKEYKGNILLIIEHNEKDGTINSIPVTFIIENGQWRRTNKYADNEELHDYLDYIKPEEIISSEIKIHPDRWNFNWYNRIKEHMEEKEWIRHFAEKVTILCMITNLKDNQGTPYSVEEIVPETILLNYLLHPQPWRFNMEKKAALIVKSKEDRYLEERKGFKKWQYTNKLLKKYKSPVMLVKFNKFKAMEILPEMIHGKEYEVTVSGELKNGKRFKGSTRIIITEWNAKQRWKWDHPDWLNSEKDIDNWWNKEKDFEDWWKKTIKKHK